MSDIERLAALLHEVRYGSLNGLMHGEGSVDCDCLDEAAALVAAGVTVGPASLNVERLGRALWNVLYPDPAVRIASDEAAAIAREYERTEP